MRAGTLTVIIVILFGALNGSARRLQADPDMAPRHDLMPVPEQVRFQPGRLAIGSAFTVAVSGLKDSRLEAGIDRAVRRLEGRIGLELARGLAGDAATATLVVECRQPGSAVPSVNEDESYTLEVSDRQAVLKAPTVVGAMRGLETFLQLLKCDRDGYYLPRVSIQDRPRFRWRGLLIDAGRHFQPVEVIKRNLDGMAAVKLNVLHWHLTEDQGFRIESRKYPRLHLMGSDGLYYTQDQVRDIIAYARDRGIRVVPEFDMPGHTTSWFVGYPELASAPGPYQIERQPGVMEPALDPTREEVYQFLDGFLGEMAGLFPDAYMHIGGDENEGKQWDRNAQIQAFMKARGIKDNHALQAYFNLRVSQILKKHGKKMIGWDEILQSELPKDVVIQSWRGPESLAQAARQGYQGILSAGYYINLMHPAAEHYLVDPVGAGSGLSAQEAARILGGEATMWSEYVSPETIDSRIWPRMAAIAERFWSPRTITDVDDMYRRLEVISLQLEELGLTHEKNTPMMLRRLAGSKQIAPLETLVSVIEPVKEYNRGKMRPTTMLSPLSNLVDAARPDSEAARHLAALVNGLLADAPRFQTNRAELTQLFARWRDVGPAVDAMSEKSAAMRDAVPLARDLSEVGAAGLEALSYLTTMTAPAKQWQEARLALLARAAEPRAAVELAIIPSLKQLIIAAAELPQLKRGTEEEWRNRIKSRAAEK
jgi:hexosaminidase